MSIEDSTTKENTDNISNSNTNNQIDSSTSPPEPKKPSLNETIQIYLRLRPCRNGSYRHDHININSDQDKIEVKVPAEDRGYVNNTIRKHTFRFDKIFDCQTTQEQIFNEVAKDVIDSIRGTFSISGKSQPKALNFAKYAISCISLVFDILFILQLYN